MEALIAMWSPSMKLCERGVPQSQNYSCVTQKSSMRCRTHLLRPSPLI